MLSCKRILKTLISYLLVFSMVIPNNIDAFADALKKDEQKTSNAKVKEINVEGQRLSDEVKNERTDVVYFGTQNIDAEEKDAAIFNVPIYRDGNLDKSESIIIRTHDIAALYGKDYILLGENKEEYESDISLLERAVTSEDNFDYKPTRYEYDIENDTIKKIGVGEIVYEDETTFEEQGSKDEENIVLKDDDTDDNEKTILFNYGINKATKSTLALWKEAETGIPSRETETTLATNLSDSIMSKLAPDFMKQLIYSSQQLITFDVGESEKILSFKILDDEISEGTEVFSISLANSEYSEIYGGNLLSVNINDDEEVENAKISFDKKTYTIKDGAINVKVLRKGNEQILVNCKLKGKIDGEIETYGMIVFAPYEKSKEFSLYVKDKTVLYFDEFVSSENGDIKEATVKKPVLSNITLFGNKPLFGDDLTSFTLNGKTYNIEVPRNSSARIFDIKSQSSGASVAELISPLPRSGIKGYSSGYFDYGEPEYGPDERYAYYFLQKGYENTPGFGIGHFHVKDTVLWGGGIGVIGAIIKQDASPLYGWKYQFIAPYWDQENKNATAVINYASRDTDESLSGGFGQVSGDYYPKRVDITSGLKITKYDADGKINPQSYLRKEVAVYSEDKYCDAKVDSHINFYGLVAFKKKYRISTEAPNSLNFKVFQTNGKYTLHSAQPVGDFRVSSGTVAKEGEDLVSYCYAGDTIRFAYSNTSLGFFREVSNIFGKLKKFEITIGPGTTSPVTLTYPDDMNRWIENVKKKPYNEQLKLFGEGTIIKDYSFEQFEKNGSVPIDSAFSMWIQDNMKVDTLNTKDTDVCGKDGNWAYYTKLKFKPIFENIPCDVSLLRVVDSENDDISKFIADAEIQKIINNTKAEDRFNYGDYLYLGTKIEKKHELDYDIDGYDISTTTGGVKFDTIRQTDYLFLNPNMKNKYLIRPAYCEKNNRIEIVMDKNDSSLLKFYKGVSFVPLEELNDYPSLRGRNILDLHPEKKNIWERICPEVGKIYYFSWIGDKKIGIVKDPLAPKKKYDATRFVFAARKNVKDNCFTITAVNDSSISNVYPSKFTVQQEMQSYRESAIKSSIVPLKNAIITYPMYDYNSGNYRDSYREESKPLDMWGTVTWNNKYMRWKNLDYTFLVSLATTGYQYIIDINVGSGYTGTSNNAEYIYTITGLNRSVPLLSSFSYKYRISGEEGQMSSDAIKIREDDIIFTSTVDSQGRKVEKIVYNIYHSDGTHFMSYDAKPKNEIFEFEIKSMHKVVQEGDYMTATIYDAEKNKYAEVDENGNKTGKIIDVDIIYPEIKLDYKFSKELVETVPKEFDMQISPDNIKGMEIPILGAPFGKTKSGTLTFDVQKIDENGSYILSINAQTCLYNSHAGEKKKTDMEIFDDFTKRISYSVKAKNEPEEEKTAAERAAKGGRATEIMMGTAEGTQKPNFNSFKNETDYHNKLAKGLDESAKSEKASLTKDAKITFEVVYCLQFYFIYDPVRKQNYLKHVGCAIGGALNAAKTWYTLVGVVPCYINLSGGVQTSVLVVGSIPLAKKITAQIFNSTEAGLLDLIKKQGGKEIGIVGDIILSGKIRAGVGICDVIGIGGYIVASVHMQGLNNNFFTQYTDEWGVVLEGRGGLEIQLFTFKYNYDIVSVKKGWGNFKDQESVTLMGEKKAGSSNDSVVNTSFSSGKDTTNIENYDYGTTNMESFGKSKVGLFGAKLHERGLKVLLEDAADMTRPHMVDLGGGKRFLTFIGARATGDKSALYYTIFDGNVWSTPKLVDDDGTADSAPEILKVGNKIVIAWMDAKEQIDGYDPNTHYKEIVTAFDVSAKVYYLDSNTLSDKKIIDHDPYYNLGISLANYGNDVYIVHMDRDTESAASIEDLLDVNKLYSTMVYNVFNIDTLIVQAKKPIEIVTKTQNDPMIIDHKNTIYQLEGHDYYLSTFTVDEDKDIKTVDDREVYLVINDLSEVGADGRMKQNRPIKITNNTLGDVTPKLTNISGEMLLTWVQDGRDFMLMYVNNIIKALFQNPDLAPSYTSRDKTTDPDWYKLSKEDANIADDNDYENSIYKELIDNKLMVESKKIIPDSADMSRSIGKYIVTKANNDAYIYFTDFTDNVDSPAIELYGMRYRGVIKDYDDYIDPITGEYDFVELNEQYGGFTDPIMITNRGYVIQDMDLFMDDDYKLYLVSDFYRHYIDTNGKYTKEPNKLIEFIYSRTNSIEVDYSSFDFHNINANNEADFSFDLVNRGLIASKGHKISAKLVKVGNPELIGDSRSNDADPGWPADVEVLSTIPVLAETDYNIGLEPGEKHKMYLDCTLPADLKDMYVVITTMETGDGVDPQSWTIYKKLPYEEKLVIQDSNFVFNKEDSKMHYTGTVVNKGNLDADAFDVILKIADKDIVVYKNRINGVKINSSIDFDFDFDMKKEYLDDYGEVRLTVDFVRNEQVIYGTATSYFSNEPILVEISNLSKIKNITTGDKVKLNIEALPWNEIAGERTYISDNPEIAYVNKNDQLVGVKEGKTNIKVVYNKNYITKNIEVNVKKKKDNNNSSSGGGGGDSGYIPALDKYLDKSIVRITGTPNTWYYNIANNKWYRIGSDGFAVSGWYLDTDGRWYFMNGEGEMLEGINCVSGKFYYFAEQDNPLTGIFKGQYLYDMPMFDSLMTTTN